MLVADAALDGGEATRPFAHVCLLWHQRQVQSLLPSWDRKHTVWFDLNGFHSQVIERAKL